MTRKTAVAWLDAFRKKDISILEENLAEDFVHTSPFGEIKGKKAYLEQVRKQPEAFFDNDLKLIDALGSDDKFAVRYEVDGTPACDCIYISDGKISRVHAYLHVGEKPGPG